MLTIAMRVHAFLLGPALGVCICAFCAGQIIGPGQISPIPNGGQTNQPAQVRTLSGTVVNSVTGEPIPRALVRLLMGQGLAALTGSDGHFEIQNVPANMMIGLMAEKPGYGQNRQPGVMRSHTIGPGENNITIKLVPQGGIHGRIVDEDGQPIEGIQVQASTEMIMNGRKREQTLSTASTDDNGEYEIDGLMPGAYFLRTRLHPLYMTQVPLAAAQQAYPDEFYPNAPDRSAAQAVQVQPGQTAEADFTLKPVQTFRISGVITGGVGRFPFIMLKGPDGERTWTSGVSYRHKTGQFTISSIPAGAWTLEIRMNPEGISNIDSGGFYAEQPVTVQDADIQNLQIALQPLAPIPVNVVHAPQTQAPNNGMSPPSLPEPQVQLIPHEASGFNPLFVGNYFAMRSKGPSATPDTLEIRGIAPGSYRVAVHTFGSECLDTITSGSTDLTTQDFIVSADAPPQPITVTLRSDCGTLSGMVHAQGRTDPVQVLVVPESGATEPQVMGSVPETQFTIAGLTPGSYRVYAFSTLDDLEYTNPDALRDFEPQETTIGPNQTANVTLNLIERGGQ